MDFYNLLSFEAMINEYFILKVTVIALLHFIHFLNSWNGKTFLDLLLIIIPNKFLTLSIMIDQKLMLFTFLYLFIQYLISLQKDESAIMIQSRFMIMIFHIPKCFIKSL